MNTRTQLPADPADSIIRDAVRADMARVYGEERRSEPREPSPAHALPSIVLRRQAE